MRKIISLILLFAVATLTVSSQNNKGKELYLKNCAACHHSNRIGKSAPPLLPSMLRKYKVAALANKIKDGFPQTQMPSFNHLDSAALFELASYIKSPITEKVTWEENDITQSIVSFNNPVKDLGIKNMEQLLPVVEREGGFVWIMEDDKVLDKFPLKNIHGGIKYEFPKAENIYIPTRDGWVEKYSLKEGRRIAKIRLGISLRNVSLTRDGKYMMVTCLLPEQIVIVSTATFEIKKIIPVAGKISALYEFYSKDKAIFTFRNKAVIGTLNTKTFALKYDTINEAIEDYFIDPYDKFIIATARRGKLLRVYDIETLELVFEHEMEGMPHLFSATYWYQDGNFYFATPHLRKPFITIWKMYDWSFQKQIEIGGDGFFVKTHPNTDFLWVDNGSDELILINKKTFELQKKIPVKGKQYIHTEFTGDGKFAYLSIYDKEGSIEVWDTKTLKKITAYKANIPVGKYNFINKNRRFYPMLFGLDIFNQNCKDEGKPNKCMQHIKTNNFYMKKAISDYLKYKK